MEVGRVGQGGPVNADYISKNEINIDKAAVKPIGEAKAASQLEKNGQDNPSKDEILKSVEKLNKVLEGENVHAEYEVHDKLKDVMIKIVNNDTKEVLLEIPPKKILDMVAKMMEMVGILLDEKA